MFVGLTFIRPLTTWLSEVSGVEPSQQGRVVLFNGKRLTASECLSGAGGVAKGNQLKVVPVK